MKLESWACAEELAKSVAKETKQNSKTDECYSTFHLQGDAVCCVSVHPSTVRRRSALWL
ncbi:hypothetical protein AOLI_G00146230 [Acnodon oligacanthus]